MLKKDIKFTDFLFVATHETKREDGTGTYLLGEFIQCTPSQRIPVMVDGKPYLDNMGRPLMDVVPAKIHPLAQPVTAIVRNSAGVGSEIRGARVVLNTTEFIASNGAVGNQQSCFVYEDDAYFVDPVVTINKILAPKNACALDENGRPTVDLAANPFKTDTNQPLVETEAEKKGS